MRRGTETLGVRQVRLGAGTGFLGGFTTFSTLAVETERHLADGAVGQGLVYVAASLVLGLGACLGGVVLAAARQRRKADRASRAEAS